MILPKGRKWERCLSHPLGLTHIAHKQIIAQPLQQIEFMMTLIYVLHPFHTGTYKNLQQIQRFSTLVQSSQAFTSKPLLKGEEMKRGNYEEIEMQDTLAPAVSKNLITLQLQCFNSNLKNVLKNVHKHVSESLCVNETFL